jgi:hypothetical protein
MAIRSIDGYSSAIAIHLEVNGQKLAVAQVGPETLILRRPAEIPPSSAAVLVINIDGRIERDQIVLPYGANMDAKLVSYF